MSSGEPGGWTPLEQGDDGSRSTQRPAVLTIGPAGENLSRTACLIHDAGNGAGQGGFGGVWGSKNLQAISVIGAGSIEIADPNALLESRLWAQKFYGMQVDHRFGKRKPQIVSWDRPKEAGLQACFGCHEGCRERSSTGLGNESSCAVTDFYDQFDKRKHRGRQTDAVKGRSLDRDKFEEFKSEYYALEGWDVSSGWPTRKTLEELGLGYVADELEAEGRLGN